jgi:hypothetical protein
MRRVLVLALAACGGGGDAHIDPDATPSDSGTNDAAPGCAVNVTFEPPVPYAFPGAKVRAVAHVSNASGVLTYMWEVKRGTQTIAFTSGAPDLSAVEFDASQADAYQTTVVVGGASETCPIIPHGVNVLVPNANSMQVRLRVYPPASVAAPPSEKLVLVNGGANMTVGVVTVDPGVMVTGNATTQAYLRFIPVASRDAYVEAFSSAAGAFSVRVLNQPHDVLVVPLVAGFAPKLVTNWLPGGNLTVDAGTAITGTVRDHNAQLLAGAKVQLSIGGVPTTLATTDGAGAFTVRASTLAGAATVDVAGPTDSGLPRLTATSNAFSFGQPVQVEYDGGLVIRDVAGAVVRRATSAQANARVSIVGTIATAGRVTTGATIVDATGDVYAHAIALGSGALPTLRVPGELLTAVVSPQLGDVTMSAIDLRAAVPATIDAPPMVSTVVQLRNQANAILPGAVFEAVPKAPLAMSGMGSVRAVADASGNLTATLAPGATYDFQFEDPFGHDVARAAGPKTETNKTSSFLTSAYNLPKGLEVKGSLALAGNPQPIGNAAVQILCASDCTGERAFPLATGASSSAGAFAVPVADPGTMPP